MNKHLRQMKLRHLQYWLGYMAVAAVSFLPGSCAKVEPGTEEEDVPRAVSFDAYLCRGVATRAGASGLLDGTRLTDEGFGVFGYHTVNTLYDMDALPNFMYNTHVSSGDGTNWTYAPLKYWPNAFGAEAESATVDRVSFFAYAPRVAADAVTGVVDNAAGATGITYLSRAEDAGDPLVSYKTSFLPAESVDLCWGIPHLNALRPAVSEKVLISFHHALSALNVQVDAPVDEVAPGGNLLDGATRIYVRSISFEGFTSRGTLNLNSLSAPTWSGYLTGGALPHDPVTIHDGRLDGREAVDANALESPTGLNPAIVQQAGYNTKPGVTSGAVNLFDSSDLTAPIFVIPNVYPLKVNLVYDVETRDDKMTSSYLSDGETHGYVSQVSVSQAIVTSGGPMRMEAGKKYVLKVHIGMTSVKFEVGVTDDWEDPYIRFELLTTGQEIQSITINRAWD